jgi:hypothetical protein
MPKEVELIPRGDRGFVSFGAPIETDAAYGADIELYESSDWGMQHAWLSLKADASAPSAPQVLSDGRVSMSAHISIEDAKELRRRLKAFIDRAEEKGFDPYDGDGN